MRKFIILTVLLFGAYLFAQQTKFYETSFDCKKVSKSGIEYKICTDKELAKLDTILNKTYKSFRLITKELKKEQIKWLKKRNRCKTDKCIKQSYEKRIKELSKAISNQNTYPKKVIDGLKDKMESHMKIYNFLNLYKYKTPKAKEFLNAFMTFKMRFKKPLIKNVPYTDKRLKKYLGDCYGFGFDYRVNPMIGKGPVERFMIEINKYDDKDTYGVYSLVDIKANNKSYYLLQVRDNDNHWFGLDYLINPKECKKLKEEIIPNDIKRGRFKNNSFYPSSKCEDLNLTKDECTTTKLRWFYIAKSSPVEAITYKGRDYLFDMNFIEGRYFNIYIKKISNRPMKGFKGLTIASINYEKGANNGK